MSENPRETQSGILPWAARMQRQLKADASTSSTYEQDRATLERLVAERKRRYPEACRVEAEPGPLTLQMGLVARAFRVGQEGGAGQALADPGFGAVYTHKLPPVRRF